MFFHHPELAYTVRVDNPNPVFARMLQQAIGGPEGELRVMTQYMFQGFGYRGPKKYRDMLLATATEEIGHIEMLATAVAMNLEGAKSTQVDDVVTNPAVAARMGALEPRHFLSAGLARCRRTPTACRSTPTASTPAATCIANMRANVAAEAIGRTLAARLLELTDDPGMQDMLNFLIARDTMHQQQWLAVLEELGPELATNAPGDYENAEEHRRDAYGFFNHLANPEAIPLDARWTSGPSLDGKGEFGVVDPLTRAGQEPDLQKAPAEVHAGIEATGDVPTTFMGRFTRNLAEKVTPG